MPEAFVNDRMPGMAFLFLGKRMTFLFHFDKTQEITVDYKELLFGMDVLSSPSRTNALQELRMFVDPQDQCDDLFAC